jgi:Peroxiredoxin
MDCCSEMARIGNKAPDFSAPAFDAGKGDFTTIKLSEYKGKYVLLFFYPGDFTYVCPTELVSLASLKDKFKEAGVEVFVVSTDSKFSHKEWHESELCKAVGCDYPFTMISDTLGRIGKPYGIFDEEEGVDLRGTVLIDKNGIVQLIYNNAPPIGRNPNEILRCVLALKEHDDNGGRVIPACWMPGDDTIDPSFENSGKMWNKYKEVIQKGVLQGGNWRIN